MENRQSLDPNIIDDQKKTKPKRKPGTKKPGRMNNTRLFTTLNFEHKRYLFGAEIRDDIHRTNGKKVTKPCQVWKKEEQAKQNGEGFTNERTPGKRGDDGLHYEMERGSSATSADGRPKNTRPWTVKGKDDHVTVCDFRRQQTKNIVIDDYKPEKKEKSIHKRIKGRGNREFGVDLPG